jgi:hypothetical protein
MNTNKVLLLKKVIVTRVQRNVPCILAIMHMNVVRDYIGLFAL